jgi:hypothetical protein
MNKLTIEALHQGKLSTEECRWKGGGVVGGQVGCGRIGGSRSTNLSWTKRQAAAAAASAPARY